MGTFYMNNAKINIEKNNTTIKVDVQGQRKDLIEMLILAMQHHKSLAVLLEHVVFYTLKPHKEERRIN